MPYMVVEQPKGAWRVYKKGANGKPEGEPHNIKPYRSKAAALPLLRALYAAEKQKAGGSDKAAAVSELDLTIISPSGGGFDPVYPQEVVGYVEQSPHVAERCGTCVFYSGAVGFCYVVASAPLTIQPDGWCDKYTELEVLADPFGVVEMPDTTASLHEAVTEVTERAALDDFVISEYRGSVPDVPDAPGIDKAALIEGDPKPTFVIRPIAEVGRTSKNGILYDQALIDSIREQIIQNRPIGIFGHIKESDRATAHPLSQAHWIGAKQYGTKLYAKAYIADPERAADIRRKKALNGADGTSIYGMGDRVKSADGSTTLRNFVLESLDFAPVDRASLDMGKEMYITSEMSVPVADNLVLLDSPDIDDQAELNPPNNPEAKETEMGDVIDPLVGLTANWKTMLPADVCEQISTALGEDKMGQVAEAFLSKQKKKVVAMEMAVVEPSVISEMNTKLDTQKVTVAELQATVQNYQRREFDASLRTAIAEATAYNAPDEARQKTLDETRGILELKARMTIKDSIDASVIAETVKAVVVNSPALMEMLRNQMMGSSAIVVGKDNHIADQTRYYDNAIDVNDPKFQEEARARVGA